MEKKDGANRALGHRDRVRKRIMANGIGQLTEVELLEYLLFLCIPRKDTKPLALNLVKRYGTLAAVIEAPPVELMEMKGMTEAAALFLSSIPDLQVAIEKSRLTNKKIIHIRQVIPIVRSLAPKDREALYVVGMDEGNFFRSVKEVFVGKKNYVLIKPRELVACVREMDVRKVILAHNHPSGDVSPSQEDYVSNQKLCDLFDEIGVQLVDHIIVGASDVHSLFWDKRVEE